MSEITSGLLGIKYAPTLAGIFGALASLSFRVGFTYPQCFFAICTGIACANYLTPVCVYYLSLPSSIELACAFVLGITGTNLVAGIVLIARKFEIDPIGFIKSRGGSQDDGDKK
jgi:hypothetical protein